MACDAGFLWDEELLTAEIIASHEVQWLLPSALEKDTVNVGPVSLKRGCNEECQTSQE